MADPQLPPGAEKVPTFRISVTEALGALVDSQSFLDAKGWLIDALYTLFTKIFSIVLRSGAAIGGFVAGALAEAEDDSQSAFGDLARVAVADMFGVQASAAALTGRGKRDARGNISVDIGDMLLRAFAGQADPNASGEIEPDDAPAKRFLSAMCQMALEGWLEGWIVEACSFGQLETFGDLDDTISHVLGLGRASAAVHGPLVKELIVNPLQMLLNLKHRPNLLGVSQIARLIARDKWPRDKGVQELARQGWSDARIEALLNEERKYFGPADLNSLINAGYYDQGSATLHLRDQGYDERQAYLELALERVKDGAQFEAALAASAVEAYVAGRFDKSELNQAIGDNFNGELWKARQLELADARRLARAKGLSPAEARACVKANVLSVVDYRAALLRDGYEPEAAIALELLLRTEIDTETKVEDHRRELEAQRAADKAARAAAAAERLAEIEAQRARQRRGSLADLRRAVVRGLIPFSRFAEVLSAEYDPDTVAILAEDVELDRAAYVDQQARADAARLRALGQALDVNDLEDAVLHEVLTVQQYRDSLIARGIPAGDVDILAATLAAKLADRRAAIAKRDEAGGKAAARAIDLGRFEQLVRRGARSLGEYDNLLEELGYDEASRAAMRELLGLKIADDAAAGDARASSTTVDPSTGWTVNDWRRAVILTVATIDQFAAVLPRLGFTSEQQTLLLAELRDDVKAAEAARRRRDKPPPAVGGPALSLGTVTSAARLGIITPAAYRQRLESDGYSSDDIELELELLLTEIAADAAAKERQAAADAAARARELGLADLAAAVKGGRATLAEYRARAIEIGYTTAAAETLAGNLAATLATMDEAAVRQAAADAAAAARPIGLADLARATRRGLSSIDTYRARALELGYTEAAADTLARLVASEIANDAAARARRTAIAAELAARGISLDELEDQVRAGTWTIDDYEAALGESGYDLATVQILGALLEAELELAPAAG